MKKHRVTITTDEAKMIVLAFASIDWRGISNPTQNKATTLVKRLCKLVELDERSHISNTIV